MQVYVQQNMFDRKVPCDEEASAVWDLRTKFLDYFDTANPAYKRARDFYPGDTQTMRSMELGTTFLSHKSSYKLDADILRMNRLEKEALRLGALGGCPRGRVPLSRKS